MASRSSLSIHRKQTSRFPLCSTRQFAHCHCCGHGDLGQKHCECPYRTKWQQAQKGRPITPFFCVVVSFETPRHAEWLVLENLSTRHPAEIFCAHRMQHLCLRPLFFQRSFTCGIGSVSSTVQSSMCHQRAGAPLPLPRDGSNRRLGIACARVIQHSAFAMLFIPFCQSHDTDVHVVSMCLASVGSCSGGLFSEQF